MPSRKSILYTYTSRNARDTVALWLRIYKNRRREKAILVHHAVTGRIRMHVLDLNQREKTKWSFVSMLCDITNAVPSLSHESMDDTLKLDKEDDTIMQ